MDPVGKRQTILEFLKPPLVPDSLIRKFPKFLADGAKKTREATRQYNCKAWSAERDINQWWEPEKLEPWFFWPVDSEPNDYSFENIVHIFKNRGYTKPSDDSFEIFHKKVAIYAIYGLIESDKWWFTHVCDQLNSGKWTSKLGPDEDIEHGSISSLAGFVEDEYGEIKLILKRRCSFFDCVARSYYKLISWF